jgi:hypothetical protein
LNPSPASPPPPSSAKPTANSAFPAPLCDFWEQAIRQVIHTNQPLETDFEVAGAHGPRIFNWRLFPECAASGRVQSILSIARDITRQKDAEQALGASEAQKPRPRQRHPRPRLRQPPRRRVPLLPRPGP